MYNVPGAILNPGWKSEVSRMNRKNNCYIKVGLLIFSVFIFVFIFSSTCRAAHAGAKNVIVLIADGCSSEQYTFARWFKGAPLSLDAIRVGAVKTYIADSVVADSAPAASAFATGVRTSDKFISVGPRADTISTVSKPPEDLQYRPLATVLEGAKLMHKATGIVCTSRITHATPAAFVSHTASRKQEDDIMEQLLHQNLDVVFGGGRGGLLSDSNKGEAGKNDNPGTLLRKEGYLLVGTRDEMANLDSGKVFGLFSEDHMAAEVDREQLGPKEPKLSEMTRKAIDILSQDPDGFFLMVEGSQIDWACHANDPAHLLGDLLAYEEAVGVALDFARNNGQTLVLALSDHNTGGFSIGNYRTSSTYSQMTPESLLDPFRKMNASAQTMWGMIEGIQTPETVMDVIQKSWGLDVTKKDAQKILSLAGLYKPYKMPYYAIGEVVCPGYTNVGWTTHGHTGGDVPLFAFGPGSPKGLVDGPEIAGICAGAMGFDLADINRRLFVEAGKAIAGAIVEINGGETENPFVTIDFKGKHFELPVNRNMLTVDGKTTRLEGLVIYAPQTNKTYIPRQAVNIIRAELKKPVK